MKMAFISSFAHLALDPDADRVSGGAELQVALLSKELVRRGHDVVVIGGDIGQKDKAVFEGVKTRTGGKFHTGGLADTLLALPKVIRVLREERPQYVAILGWTTWLYMIDRLKSFIGYRSIFICGLDTEVNGEFRRENPVRGRFFERAVQDCDFRFAMSEYQQEQFARNGQACGFYRNLILPRSGKRPVEKTVDFLWVARCQPIKRPHLFLDLAEKLPASRFEMICPREDEALWQSVQKRAKGLGNMDFKERVPYRMIQGRYDAAHILVNTSSWEGFPNSFIQAGQGNAALLSLRVNPDGLFERFNVGFCAVDDFDAFANRAVGMVEDRQLLAGMQDESARFVAEWHDNGKNVDAFLEGLSL